MDVSGGRGGKGRSEERSDGASMRGNFMQQADGKVVCKLCGAQVDIPEGEKPKVSFEIGETVKINNGPFLNFSGVIEEVEPERGKLKVTVNIFGRNTPVELEYWQVEKG